MELSHDRKFFFDWGFQQNYDLPWNSSSFYNIPIWSGFKDGKVRNKRELFESIELKYGVGMNGIHPNDFTAGEFYEALENLLVRWKYVLYLHLIRNLTYIISSYGFHETCLLKSVCELARYPFDENYNNIVSEIITFILR